jgi:hypothetical protein
VRRTLQAKAEEEARASALAERGEEELDSSPAPELGQGEKSTTSSPTAGRGNPFSPGSIGEKAPTVTAQRLCSECERKREGQQEEEEQSSSRGLIQPKLTIGEPGDPYEQEADRVAKQVVSRMKAPEIPTFPVEPGKTLQSQGMISVLQRLRESEKQIQLQHERTMLQRITRPAVKPSVPNVQGDFETTLNRARGGGSPLDHAFRAKVEPAMGADFSGVKVHTDSEADQLNRSIQAKAFTTGQDIFFRQGEYNPGSKQGQELLAHELTHVVQQTEKVLRKQVPDIQRNPIIQANEYNLELAFNANFEQFKCQVISLVGERVMYRTEDRATPLVEHSNLFVVHRHLLKSGLQNGVVVSIHASFNRIGERVEGIHFSLREERIYEETMEYIIGEREYPPGEEPTETSIPEVETPELQNCRETMQQSLPLAHRYALEKAAENANYYEQLVNIITQCTSLQEVQAQIGRAAGNDLFVRWGIPVSSDLREYLQLPASLSTSEIQTQIVEPIEHIAGVYRLVEEGLRSRNFNYECEYRDSWWYQGCDGEVIAWTPRNIRGDIHLCVDDLDPNDIEALASNIVHEASHRFGNTTDELEPKIENAHNYDELDVIPESPSL